LTLITYRAGAASMGPMVTGSQVTPHHQDPVTAG
jgi:hypothetical protein